MGMDRTGVTDITALNTCAALTAHPCEVSAVTVSILQMRKLTGKREPCGRTGTPACPQVWIIKIIFQQFHVCILSL